VRHLEHGESVKDAAVNGSREISHGHLDDIVAGGGVNPRPLLGASPSAACSGVRSRRRRDPGPGFVSLTLTPCRSRWPGAKRRTRCTAVLSGDRARVETSPLVCEPASPGDGPPRPPGCLLRWAS
jgi:hypothetical protein